MSYVIELSLGDELRERRWQISLYDIMDQLIRRINMMKN